MMVLQAQLSVTEDQDAQRANKLAELSALHEALQASTTAQDASLQTLREEHSVTCAHAQQLQMQLDDKTSELQSTQDQVQQKIDSHSKLEQTLSAQAAELGTVSEQCARLQADKQQLELEVQVVASDRQQLHSSLKSHQADSAEQLFKVKDEIQQVQVCHMIHHHA